LKKSKKDVYATFSKKQKFLNTMVVFIVAYIFNIKQNAICPAHGGEHSFFKRKILIQFKEVEDGDNDEEYISGSFFCLEKI
jgi:hypothetical protein